MSTGRRNSGACQTCRTLKIKCVGLDIGSSLGNSTCQHCARTGAKCERPHDRRKTPSSKVYVNHLKQRISKLERMINSTNTDERDDLCTTERAVTSTDENFLGPHLSSNQQRIDTPHDRLLAANEEEMDPADATLHAICSNLGAMSLGLDKNHQYFGAMSGLHFSQTPAARVFDYPVDDDNDCPHLRRNSSCSIDGILTNAQTEELLQLYWTWQNPFSVVVDKSLFQRDRVLFQLNPNDNTISFFSPVLFLSMLAIATWFSNSPEIRFYGGRKVGIMLSQRARELFFMEVGRPSLTTVQSGLLLSHHDGIAGFDTMGWFYSGVACRMAIQLGLHLDPSQITFKAPPGLRDETAICRRMVYWSAFNLDLLWSMYLGRPPLLSDADCSVSETNAVRQSLEEELWSAYFGVGLEHIDTFYIPSRICSSFLYSIKLSKIGSQVAREIYSISQRDDKAKVEKVASHIHMQLCKWHSDLPEPLRWKNTTGHSTHNQEVLPPHVMILLMQAQTIGILAFRPFLIKHSTGAEFRSVVHRNCVEYANQILQLLLSYRRTFGLRRIESTAVHIALTASSIHLFLYRTSASDETKRTARLNLRSELACLSEMSESLPLACRALAALRGVSGSLADPTDDNNFGNDSLVSVRQYIAGTNEHDYMRKEYPRAASEFARTNLDIIGSDQHNSGLYPFLPDEQSFSDSHFPGISYHPGATDPIGAALFHGNPAETLWNSAEQNLVDIDHWSCNHVDETSLGKIAH